jgi:hypothetical protein
MAWQGPSGTTPRTAVTTRQYRRDARARGAPWLVAIRQLNGMEC